jgi:hypothetical protein
MRYEIKSIGLWAFIKVSFLFNLVAGFLCGLFLGLLIAFATSLIYQYPELEGLFGEDLLSMSADALIVFLPILCALGAALFNTILGVILVLVYNVIARLVGGYEIVLEMTERTATGPPQAPPAAEAARPALFPASPSAPLQREIPPTPPHAPPSPPPSDTPGPDQGPPPGTENP